MLLLQDLLAIASGSLVGFSLGLVGGGRNVAIAGPWRALTTSFAVFILVVAGYTAWRSMNAI